ncbi:hypothetical protein EON65_25755 [archaeon]|nr:MAG: hypothetical protein EON65_25755 [archaeon]
MAKNVNVARRFQEQRRDRENLLIVKFLESARSSYARKDLKHNYDRNRVAYRLFNTKTPHYALHLGLVKTAQDRIERRNKMAAHHYHAISASSSRHKSRPLSAPHVHKYDRQSLQEVDKIKDIHDFYDFKEIDRQLRNPNKEWDGTPNDNLYNSNYNIVDNKHASVYSKPTRRKSSFFSDIDYLSDSVKITDVASELQKQREIEEHGRRSKTGSHDHGGRSAPAPRVDLLNVKPKNIIKARPQTANPLRGGISSSKAKDGSRQRNKPGHSDKGAEHPNASNSRKACGQDSSNQSLTPQASFSPPSDAMQRLSSLRKNVSFQQLENAEDDNGDFPMAAQDSVTFLSEERLDAHNRSNNSSAKIKKRAGISRAVSLISELGTEEDPTAPTSQNKEQDEYVRRMSIILESPFLNNDAGTTAGNAVAVNPEHLLRSLGIYFRSKFHFPVRCQPIPFVYNKRVTWPEFPFEAVYVAVYDVGYCLPGNEGGTKALEAHLAELDANKPVVPEDNSNYTSSAIPFSPSSDRYSGSKYDMKEQAEGAVQSKRKKLNMDGMQSAVLKHIPGLSLPTTAGILVVIHSPNPEIESAFQYFSVTQALQARFSTYEHSLPRTVLTEMQAFSYPFGPESFLSTPQEINTNSIGRDEAKAELTVDTDSQKATIFPCLLDMMDTEVAFGFVEAIVNNIGLQYNAHQCKIELLH